MSLSMKNVTKNLFIELKGFGLNMLQLMTHNTMISFPSIFNNHTIVRMKSPRCLKNNLLFFLIATFLQLTKRGYGQSYGLAELPPKNEEKLCAIEDYINIYQAFYEHVLHFGRSCSRCTNPISTHGPTLKSRTIIQGPVMVSPKAIRWSHTWVHSVGLGET